MARIRKFPAPLTGHDLMALFPPAPPNNFEMCPTIDFLKHRERAFFAGKEIVRVRVEVDFPHGSELDVKQRPASRPWLNGPGPGPGPSSYTTDLEPHHSLGQSPSAPVPYPHPTTAPSVSVAVNPEPFPIFPPQAFSSHTSTSNQLPSNIHPPGHQTTLGLRTPPEDGTTLLNSTKPKYYIEEYEAWRTPMPHSERRRAGKHTKRAILSTRI
jgi:hypothetical protein